MRMYLLPKRNNFSGSKMNNPDISKGPVFDSGYRPYFYQSGKFLSYDIPHTSSESSYFPRTSGYDFTSDIVHKNDWPKLKTVEDIISSGYFPIPKSEREMLRLLPSGPRGWYAMESRRDRLALRKVPTFYFDELERKYLEWLTSNNREAPQ